MRSLDGKWLSTETDSAILGFFGEHRWLSNFHVCPVQFDGVMYPSSENAYQAAKCIDKETRERYFVGCLPNEAKKFGSLMVDLRPRWLELRYNIMANILEDKFSRNPELREKLLATGNKYLEETNYWGDRFWGVCNGQGENKLGEILMRTRELLDLQLL